MTGIHGDRFTIPSTVTRRKIDFNELHTESKHNPSMLLFKACYTPIHLTVADPFEAVRGRREAGKVEVVFQNVQIEPSNFQRPEEY
jgi:hypothetical protein